MTLLVIVASLLSVGFSITYPTLTTRFQVVVDTCINNVTYPGSNYQDFGSIICRCSDYSVACTAYEDNDCSGEEYNSVSWGGCEQDVFTTRYFYRVDNCSNAQEEAADNTCSYFVDDESGPNWSTIEDAVKPIGSCMDYNCGGTNSDSDSKSCMFGWDGNNITYREYRDYYCENEELYNPNYDYLQRQNQNGGNCAVTVSQYEVGETSYYCGSDSTKWSIPSGVKASPNKNYILLNAFNSPPDSIPLPIGECFEVRDGYHKYSWEYQCFNPGTPGSNVGRYIYLDSDTCSDENSKYLVQNYSSEDYTIDCSNSGSARGKIGDYTEGCYSFNPDAHYVESGELFNQCVQFRSSPNATTGNDGSLYQNQPWNKDLRMVRGCALNNKYRVHYFFAKADCTGDYVFNFDEDGWYDYYTSSTSGYSQCPARRLKIEGCESGVGGINVNHLA